MNRRQFERSIKAALVGPELKKARFGAHDFNVKPLAATVSGSTINVVGRISHHRTLQGDEQIRYEAVIRTARRVQIKPVQMTIRTPVFAQVLDVALGLALAPMKALLTNPLPPGVSLEEFAVHAGRIATGKLFDGSSELLEDGDWEGEALFLISNVLGRLGLAAATPGDLESLPQRALRFDPFRPTHTAPPAKARPGGARTTPPSEPRRRRTRTAPPAKARPRPSRTAPPAKARARRTHTAPPAKAHPQSRERG